jgi:precorrin-6Y C5,15-methyltransferase (decarboxylating)
VGDGVTGWFGEPGAPALPPVTVIGYDGSPLSAQAREALDAADLVLGGQRHLAAAGVSCRTVVLGALDPALEELDEARARGERVAVLASGDPGFFGIVRRLTSRYGPQLDVVVLPAVSSVAQAFARLGVPWDDAVVVSAHGRPWGPALNVWRRFQHSPQRVAVLTDAQSSPAALIEALGEEFDGCEVLERLGEPEERRLSVLPCEPAPEVTDPSVLGRAAALARDWSAPHVLVSRARTRPRGDAPWLAGRPVPPGWALPDDAFAHRDRMLTKREVRAVALSRLAPAVGALVWDVGSGSGSLAVECSRLGAAAIAVERDPEALQHIRDNAQTHQAPVRVVHGTAPAALDGLPWPDAVFVGGGGPDVVAAVAAVRPTRVVVALATLERVAPTVAALQGYAVDTALLQVSHLQPLGEGHRLAPANPVFLVSGALP